MSVCVCLTVCPIFTKLSLHVTYTDERINLVLARKLFSTSHTLCFKETQMCTNKGASPLKLFPKLRTLKISFRHGISIVERAINLARERWTLRE